MQQAKEEYRSPRSWVTGRCQQRGISEEGVSITIRYGRKVYWYHGAILYYLGSRELAAAWAAEPALRYRVDHLQGIAVVVGIASGELITTFKEKRGIHRIAQNYGGRKRKCPTKSSDLTDESETDWIFSGGSYLDFVHSSELACQTT